MVSHTEPDILECEVKWALGSTAVNKASECDRILVRAIQNPKGRCYQCVALNMSANLEDPAVATGLEKSILIQIPKKSSTKNVLTIGQLHLSPMLERLCLNFAC